MVQLLKNPSKTNFFVVSVYLYSVIRLQYALIYSEVDVDNCISVSSTYGLLDPTNEFTTLNPSIHATIHIFYLIKFIDNIKVVFDSMFRKEIEKIEAQFECSIFMWFHEMFKYILALFGNDECTDNFVFV